MGSGIDLARADAPEHAALLDDMKDQLILVLIRRLCASDAEGIRAGRQRLTIPVGEVDDTGGLLLAFSVDVEQREFNFELRRKS